MSLVVCPSHVSDTFNTGAKLQLYLMLPVLEGILSLYPTNGNGIKRVRMA